MKTACFNLGEVRDDAREKHVLLAAQILNPGKKRIIGQIT